MFCPLIKDKCHVYCIFETKDGCGIIELIRAIMQKLKE